VDRDAFFFAGSRFKGVGADLGDLAVLPRRRAGCADSADDLAVLHDGNAALDRRRVA